MLVFSAFAFAVLLPLLSLALTNTLQHTNTPTHHMGDLHKLVLEGWDVPGVRRLLESPSVNVNRFDTEGFTGTRDNTHTRDAIHRVRSYTSIFAFARISSKALHQAVKSGNIDMVQVLLSDPRTDVNIASPLSRATPLHTSATYGRPEILRLLLEHKALVNATGKEAITPLHSAANKGMIECCKELLAHQADVDCASSSTCATPLHIAAKVCITAQDCLPHI